MIFLTPMGVVEKANTPAQIENPLKRTKQGLESINRARARYSHTPNTFQAVTEANKHHRGTAGEQRRNGTHQPHRILRTPTLAATTHHPSPTARPNRMPTLRSRDHLGHTRPTNQPRSRPHHTRQQGRTQHPRQRPNHLQNMQQKQRQSQRTKHSIQTTNHKNTRLLVIKPPTPTGDTPCTPVQDLVRLSEIPPFCGLVYLSTFCVGGECCAA